jgi:uncharacterized repeat protein (TIGR01451 family)
LPGVSRTVDFDDGVYSGPVTVKLSGGTFHGATDTPYGDATAGSTLFISRPKVALSVAADMPTVAAGSPITYTYEARNDSTSFPGDTGLLGMSDSEITDDRCAPVTYVSGDGGWADLLDVGETWTFTCTTTINQVGPITNHATYTGGSSRDGMPVTASAESSVTTTGTDMTVGMSHSVPFVRGAESTFSIDVRNSGNVASSGSVDVQAALPAGLTATAMSGSGWNCAVGASLCSRNDTLAADADYPPISLTVAVAGDAQDQVTATAEVSGGGDADPSNNSASDSAAVADPVTTDPDPGKAVFSRLVLKPKTKKVKAGKRVKLTLRITNSGTARGTASI